jgi:hypothetical protein
VYDGGVILLLLACTAPPCDDGFSRGEDGNCYGGATTGLTGATDTGSSDTDTDTTEPVSPVPEIVYYEQLWPAEDEGWVSMHYHAHDGDDDVIGGTYYASVTNGTRAFIVDVAIIWADDRCPAGTHSAFECCTLYLNDVLTMYIAGVDQQSTWTVTSFIVDEEGHQSNTSVDVATAPAP